jgi:hypothetical protein
MTSFDPDRYSRQTRFAPVGVDGQMRLAAGSVAVVGCGALGSVVALALVRAGVGFLRLIDRDVPERSNLPRQVLFDEADVAAGLPKAVAAARHLTAINSAATIEPVVADLTAANVADLLGGVDVIVDASGARCELLDGLGFSQTVALRSARALCIVISLQNKKTKEELELRESTWSQQFYQGEFGALEKQGIVLENLVYYRSTGAFAETATHYFVMTTTAEALEGYGALLRGVADQAARAETLCHGSNVDTAKAEAYARQAIAAFVPSLAAEPMVPGNLSLFDFSERKQSNRAAIAVPGMQLGGRQETVCIATRVGDALQEPFW